MGLRQWLDRNPRIAVASFGGVVAIAVGLIVVQVMGSRQKFPTKLPSAYYSTDDGKTFFELGSENLAPFDYKGQPAVRAYVFDCGGTKFVGYLERYKPEARAKLLAGKDVTPQVQISGRELKKPGETKWISSGDFASVAKVANVKCPDGHIPEPVEP
jgi:hypothetical protein